MKLPQIKVQLYQSTDKQSYYLITQSIYKDGSIQSDIIQYNKNNKKSNDFKSAFYSNNILNY